MDEEAYTDLLVGAVESDAAVLFRLGGIGYSVDKMSPCLLFQLD